MKNVRLILVVALCAFNLGMIAADQAKPSQSAPAEIRRELETKIKNDKPSTITQDPRDAEIVDPEAIDLIEELFAYVNAGDLKGLQRFCEKHPKQNLDIIKRFEGHKTRYQKITSDNLSHATFNGVAREYWQTPYLRASFLHRWGRQGQKEIMEFLKKKGADTRDVLPEEVPEEWRLY